MLIKNNKVSCIESDDRCKEITTLTCYVFNFSFFNIIDCSISFFSGKENHYDTVGEHQPQQHDNHHDDQHQGGDRDGRPRLMFHCQLAQGSPTGIISGFTNVK